VSDKPQGYPYTAKNQEVDLDAVVRQLNLGQVVLVAHDASGPPAIDWALNHPNQVAALILLNTYYCAMPTLRAPEAIFLFSYASRTECCATDLTNVRLPDLPPYVLVASR
jgi:haloalkane dehalogenase